MTAPQGKAHKSSLNHTFVFKIDGEVYLSFFPKKEHTLSVDDELVVQCSSKDSAQLYMLLHGLIPSPWLNEHGGCFDYDDKMRAYHRPAQRSRLDNSRRNGRLEKWM